MPQTHQKKHLQNVQKMCPKNPNVAMFLIYQINIRRSYFFPQKIKSCKTDPLIFINHYLGLEQNVDQIKSMQKVKYGFMVL